MPEFVLKYNVESQKEFSRYATRVRLGSTFCLDLASCQLGDTSCLYTCAELKFAWFVYFDCKLFRADLLLACDKNAGLCVW